MNISKQFKDELRISSHSIELSEFFRLAKLYRVKAQIFNDENYNVFASFEVNIENIELHFFSSHVTNEQLEPYLSQIKKR